MSKRTDRKKSRFWNKLRTGPLFRQKEKRNFSNSTENFIIKIRKFNPTTFRKNQVKKKERCGLNVDFTQSHKLIRPCIESVFYWSCNKLLFRMNEKRHFWKFWIKISYKTLLWICRTRDPNPNLRNMASIFSKIWVLESKAVKSKYHDFESTALLTVWWARSNLVKRWQFRNIFWF